MKRKFVFEEAPKKGKARLCDHPGCTAEAEYRAPKDRTLSEYYWFCLDHVKEYNKNWNYYAGMTIEDMQKLHKFETLWDRPLNPFAQGGVKFSPKNIGLIDYFDLFNHYNYVSTAPSDAAFTKEQLSAMSIFELSSSNAPFKKSELKARYNKLAKLYHPDIAKGDKKKSEHFAAIASAYKILLEIAH